jgi:site-specific recombinase XerD
MLDCNNSMDIQILAHQFYEYSLSIRGYSKATIRRYRFSIAIFCKMTGISLISEITDERVRQFFFDGRTQRGWSSQTYILYRISLLVFFRWCISHGCMTHNPMEKIEVPKLEKRIPRSLTLQHALKILEVVDNFPHEFPLLRYRNHAIFATFIHAGLRKQELLNLKYTDVDLVNLTIFVRLGKGNKDRIIPISYVLGQSLKRYVTERNRMRKTCSEFFVSSNHNMGFTDSGLKRLTVAITHASGICFSVHKLRHTFATLMLEGGCDIYSLSKMMGHSDIKTTTIYLSASVEHLRSQITKHPISTSLNSIQ